MSQLALPFGYLGFTGKGNYFQWIVTFLIVTLLHTLVFLPLKQPKQEESDQSNINAVPIIVSAVVATEINASQALAQQQHILQQQQKTSSSVRENSSVTSQLEWLEDEQGEILAADTIRDDNTLPKQIPIEEKVSEETELTNTVDAPTEVKDAKDHSPDTGEQLSQVDEQLGTQRETNEKALSDSDGVKANDTNELAQQTSAPESSYSAQSEAAIAGNWQSRLMSYLAKAKKYPRMARKKKEQGTVIVYFVINRAGEVLKAKVQKGSPFKALNQEALALIRRAAPLPKPPEELQGQEFQLAVPIEFYIH